MIEESETPEMGAQSKAGDVLAERRARRDAANDPAVIRRAEAAEAVVRNLETHLAALEQRLEEVGQERERIAEQLGAREREVVQIKQGEYAEQQLRVEAEERNERAQKEMRAQMQALNGRLDETESHARELSMELEDVRRELSESQQAIALGERLRERGEELRERMVALEGRFTEMQHEVGVEREARRQAEVELAHLRERDARLTPIVGELMQVAAELRSGFEHELATLREELQRQVIWERETYVRELTAMGSRMEDLRFELARTAADLRTQLAEPPPVSLLQPTAAPESEREVAHRQEMADALVAAVDRLRTRVAQVKDLENPEQAPDSDFAPEVDTAIEIQPEAAVEAEPEVIWTNPGAPADVADSPSPAVSWHPPASVEEQQPDSPEQAQVDVSPPVEPMAEPPVVEPPVAEAPPVEAPAVEPPVAEILPVEAASAEPPPVEPLAVEPPVVEPPVIEPPAAEAPVEPEVAIEPAPSPIDQSLAPPEAIGVADALEPPQPVGEAVIPEPPVVEPTDALQPPVEETPLIEEPPTVSETPVIAVSPRAGLSPSGVGVKPVTSAPVALQPRPMPAPATRSSWLAPAIRRLATKRDAKLAAELVIELIPAQQQIVDSVLHYQMKVDELGTFHVALESGHAVISREPSTAPLDFVLEGSAAAFSELAAGGASRKPAGLRIRKGRRRAKRLLKARRSPITLAELAAEGIDVWPGLLLLVMAEAIDPSWTTGRRFELAFEIQDAPGIVIYVRICDGEPIIVSRAAAKHPVATVSVSSHALICLLAGMPVPPDHNALVTGDTTSVEMFLQWSARAQGLIGSAA